MGFMDFIFGKEAESTITPTSRLSSEQQQLMTQITQFFAAGGGPAGQEAFPGDLVAPISDLERTSLAGLEAEAVQRVTGGTPIQQESEQALLDIFKQDPTSIDEFFRTTVGDPALKDFTRDILPAIDRKAGNQFFGSERRETERRATEDLLESLTRRRSEFGFAAREADRDAVLRALGLAPGVGGAGISELSQLLEAGQAGAGRETQLLLAEFEKFQEQKSREEERARLIAQILNVGAQENIVTTTGGTTGLLGSVLSNAAKGFGFAAGGNVFAGGGGGGGDIFGAGGPA